MFTIRMIMYRTFAVLFFFSLMMTTTNTPAGNPADLTHGFRLVEKRFVKEQNAECLYFIHEKSGARLLKIEAKDPNKTFCIAFKTFPESDAGTPHIMEHSVLNGSKNFPVKSPFDVLVKGSLKTFINAFTGKDMTAYPVASMNEKDYFNLMHVYLDAVFNPLIYTDNRIMDQEGWHYELSDPAQPVVYKGVVYNEMKGAYSSPTRELSYQMYRTLFPDNPYGFESGGYPAAIPTLTHEQFRNFHKRYYHPENSYILLYGDADLNRELEFIDREYLSKYNVADNLPMVQDQKPFSSPKELTAFYPVLEDAKTGDQTYLSMGFVYGKGTDLQLSMGLDILMEVLVNQESAPVRKALEEAGIGQDVSAYNSSYQQNVIQITVQNANPDQAGKFREIVMSVLKEQSEKGLDPKAVEGVVNRTEFQLREGNDAQKGLSAAFQTVGGWFHAGDPFLGLEWEKPLAAFKKSIGEKYLEELIRTSMLNNPHALLLTLAPKPGLDKEVSERTTAELAAFKADMSEDQIKEMIRATEELIAYQKAEDTPEALATIPMLSRKDINPQAAFYQVTPGKAGETPLLHYNTFTNGVVYMKLLFDLHTLPQEMIPYASLLSNVLTLLNTRDYSYGDLNTELNIHTGGFNTNLSTYPEGMDDNRLIAKFSVTSKAMPGKLDMMFNLTGEVLLRTLFNDPERLKQVISRHQAQMEASMKREGSPVASRRLASYYSNQGAFNELTSGLEYFWFVSDLAQNFDGNSEQIMNALKEVSSKLFTAGNLTACVTCSEKELEGYTTNLIRFTGDLPAGDQTLHPWKFQFESRDEAIETPSKVQYVMQGYNYKKLGFQWDGRMKVLSQVLSTDYLQTRIRVIGGAYGGYSTISPAGFITFNSYRDPNLKETLVNYDSIPDYLAKFNAGEDDMTRYIIGTIAGMDSPMTPAGKGDLSVNYYFTGRTAADLQRERDAVINTQAEDIRGFSKLTRAVLDQRTWCVYGNATKIGENKDLFKTILQLDKP